MVWVGEIPRSPETESKIVVDETDYVEEETIRAPFSTRDVAVRSELVDDYYEILTEIGVGKFGTVYKCREKSTGLTLAAKYVPIENARRQAEVEHEVKIMRRLKHPRIIQIYDAFSSPLEMVLVMELVEGGELFERLVEDEFLLTENAVIMIMRQVCDGMRYIHSQDIVHLDMKPENILCLSRSGNRIKMIDFGLAQEYYPGKDLKIIVGTPEFLAPEVVSYDPLSYKTDQWSIGVICYILLSGISPFLGETMAQTYGHVHKGVWRFEEEYFANVSKSAKDFISKLLVYDRDSRMSAEDCLEHVWLKRRENSVTKQYSKELNKTKLKSYLVKRRWRKAINAIMALRHMAGRSISESSENTDTITELLDSCNKTAIQDLSESSSSQIRDPEPSSSFVKPVKALKKSDQMKEQSAHPESSEKKQHNTESKWEILQKSDGYLSNIVLPFS